MRKKSLVPGIILLASLGLASFAQTRPDEKLFQGAKIFIFDKMWEKAQAKLDEILEKYPESHWFSQALFYKGKCLEEQKGKELESMAVYEEYLALKDRSESLAEESEISLIDLAYRLYEKGKKSYLKEIEKRTLHPNRVVRYYAAFELSYVKDKNMARKSIPVLREILDKVKDEELRDKAKIALLRVDPDVLREFEEKKSERKVRVFHLVIQDRWKKEPDLSLNIPWALADLALHSIPAEAKDELKEEGYDIDRIIRDLNEFKGKLIEIKTKQSVIKIWID